MSGGAELIRGNLRVLPANTLAARLAAADFDLIDGHDRRRSRGVGDRDDLAAVGTEISAAAGAGVLPDMGADRRLAVALGLGRGTAFEAAAAGLARGWLRIRR